MKILGIDPGYDRIGIAIVEKSQKNKEHVVHSECFSTVSSDEIYERLLQIGDKLVKIFDLYKPDHMAIETLFITKNQKTAMRVAEARGIMIYEAVKRQIPVYEYSPMQIKMAVTGDGTSDKTRMTKMIHILVEKLSKKKYDDEYDAIAVALTHSAISR